MAETPLSPSEQRVQDALTGFGLPSRIRVMPDSTRTAAAAATALGCTIGQIVKSLIFKTKETHRGVLILASGSNRVDESLIGEVLGEAIERADPDFVREQTGYAIGGVPPVGHAHAMVTLIDPDLLLYDIVYAAGGTPHAIFPIDPKELERISGGKVNRISNPPAGNIP
jgi:prolyl-tRNA editing enzyme YbaK/EbsC (Cys-tRNA(Pro) deacylase)